MSNSMSEKKEMMNGREDEEVRNNKDKLCRQAAPNIVDHGDSQLNRVGVPIAGGLTDSDFQEGSYEDDGDEHSTEDEDVGGGNVAASDEDDDDQDEVEDSESEINDAGLLRSMLRDSEDYYENLAAEEAREEKHCWVCFASEEDDPLAMWSHPCR